MKILDVADGAFTDQHWREYYALLETLHDRYDSQLFRIGWEQNRDRVQSLIASHPAYHRFVVYDESEPVGWADFTVFAPGTEGQCVSVRLDSIYAEASLEFERKIAEEILRLMESYGVQSGHIMAMDERVSGIMDRWRSQELNRIDRFRLVRAKAHTSAMTEWLNRIPRDNPNLRMEFLSPIPDEHLEAHTKLFVSYIREMPTERETEKPFQMTVEEARRDREWRRTNKVQLYTFALFDSDEMIGHTNAVINEDDPSDAYQAITGVNREYRGRGLSRWLNAALFFKVGEDFPSNETMTTVMRATNVPIQKVNAEMGYVHTSTGHEFDIRADGLRRYLED